MHRLLKPISVATSFSFLSFIFAPPSWSSSASYRKFGEEVFGPAARGVDGAAAGTRSAGSGSSSSGGYGGGSAPHGATPGTRSDESFVRGNDGSYTQHINGTSYTMRPPGGLGNPLTTDWGAVRAKRAEEAAENTRLQRQADNEKFLQERRLNEERLAAQQRQEQKAFEQKRIVDEAQQAKVRQQKLFQQQASELTRKTDSNPLTADWNNVKARQQAKNPADSLALKKKLASEQQMVEDGRILAGGDSTEPFENANRASNVYGGKPEDWLKKSSSKYTAPDGQHIETRWIENSRTKERQEFKTIVNPDVRAIKK